MAGTHPRMPGGVVPRHPRPGAAPAEDMGPAGGAAQRTARPAGAPFDRAERPLGMIPQTWVPTDEPVILSAAEREPRGGAGGFGPSLTVWIILVTVVVLVVLAVVSYRNAPP